MTIWQTITALSIAEMAIETIGDLIGDELDLSPESLKELQQALNDFLNQEPPSETAHIHASQS